MTEVKAKQILSRPLVFGDEEQIAAVHVIEELADMKEVKLEVFFRGSETITAKGNNNKQLDEFVEHWLMTECEYPELYDDWKIL